VTEETGLVCDPGPELALVAYRDGRGRSKTVRYWAMTVAGEGEGTGPEDPDEVDEVAWVDPARARRLLTYERDARVLEAFEARAHLGDLAC
jgi:8-oxo-dGTP pyrophosphatase MutT (NUDIX family)